MTEMEKQVENESKSIFGETEDDEEHEIKKGVFFDYDWNDEDNYNEKKNPNDKLNYMMRSKNNKQDDKKEETKTEQKKSELEKKTEECEEKMEKLHLNLENEIKFNFFDKSLEISTNFAWDYSKDIHGGWQIPFTFPACPVVQIRIGFKFSVYYKIVIGLQISFSAENNKDPEFVIKPYTELSVGAKIDGIAEGGLYGGIASIYGGLSGTLIDAKLQGKLYVYVLKAYIDDLISLSIYALQFRVYVESEIKILWWTNKIVLLEYTFGLKKPLLNLYFYVRKNFQLQVIEGDKNLQLDSIFK
jgi:hypothetical protein